MGIIPRLHLPMRRPEDVIPYLGSPDQWRDFRSAKLIAESWFGTTDLSGLPEMVRVTLSRCPSNQAARFSGVELVDGFIERCIELGDGLRPSQTDVLAVLGLQNGLGVMAVEGKVDESFGPLVSEWLRDAARGSRKPERLKRLATTLELDPLDCGPLRYQLLHRTASALYEARRYRATTAIMMVHSFDPHDTGIGDFKTFASRMGMPEAGPTHLVGPVTREGIELFLGWTADRPSNEGYVLVDGRKTDAGLLSPEC